MVFRLTFVQGIVRSVKVRNYSYIVILKNKATRLSILFAASNVTILP
jgi:hypothetical protein